MDSEQKRGYIFHNNDPKPSQYNRDRACEELIQLKNGPKIGYQHVLLVLVLVACLLRFSMALANRIANDNHLTVIQIIQAEGKTPDASRCRACFHPKFFYLISSYLLNALEVSANDPNKAPAKIILQLMNSAVGMLGLLICFMLICEILPNRRYRLYLFALLALNPPLLVAGAQVSNDIFAITFSTAALYFTFKGWKTGWRNRYLAAAILLSAMANITKPTALPIMASLFALLGFSLLIRRDRRSLMAVVFAALLVAGSTLLLGEYVRNYRKFANPFVDSYGGKIASMSHPGIPFIWRESEKWHSSRHGVVAWVNSFFTFRIISLMRDPTVPTVRQKPLPIHMTSLWTQLFARFHIVRYHFWPPFYHSTSPFDLWLYRLTFALGLIPFGLLVTGLLGTLQRIFSNRFSIREHILNGSSEFFLLCSFSAALSFYGAFNFFKLNDNAAKVIYFLPGGLLPVLYLISAALRRLPQSWIARSKIGMVAIEASLVGLAVCYLFENMALLKKMVGDISILSQ